MNSLSRLSGVVGFLLLAAVSMAGRDTRDVAHDAVRDLISDNRGPKPRVDFSSTKESFFSPTEVLVKGEGFVVRRGERREQQFEYRAVVRRNRPEARDVEVRFESGLTLRSGDDRPRPSQDDVTRVRISSPRNNERVSERGVTLEGDSNDRKVKVELFRSDGKRVFQRDVEVRRDRWSVRTDLREGPYRLIVTSPGGGSATTRFFAGRDDGPDWGFDGGPSDRPTRLEVDFPGNNPRMPLSFLIKGRSDSRKVTLRVYDEDGKQVYNSDGLVINGRFGASVKVRDRGRYRIEIEQVDGRGRATLRFEAR